jgi:hypothetical protein
MCSPTLFFFLGLVLFFPPILYRYSLFTFNQFFFKIEKNDQISFRPLSHYKNAKITIFALGGGDLLTFGYLYEPWDIHVGIGTGIGYLLKKYFHTNPVWVWGFKIDDFWMVSGGYMT